MMARIPSELVLSRARDDEHARILTELALTSYMCVPLVCTSGTVGAISFVYGESGRHYTDTRPDAGTGTRCAGGNGD